MAAAIPDRPGDVLAHPTRARVFARLASIGRPVGTAELASELELHPSGVRVHLERLRSAGLIEREQVLQTRGRPRHLWSVAADARPGPEPPGAYVELARWLARSIPARPARLHDVHRTGREVGRELPAPAHGSAEERMGQTLTALGFAPQRDRPASGEVVFRLGNCPYRQAVRENQPVVCELHRGLTRGVLDQLAPSARLAAFVPQDPDHAGCLIGLTGLPT